MSDYQHPTGPLDREERDALVYLSRSASGQVPWEDIARYEATVEQVEGVLRLVGEGIVTTILYENSGDLGVHLDWWTDGDRTLVRELSRIQYLLGDLPPMPAAWVEALRADEGGDR